MEQAHLLISKDSNSLATQVLPVELLHSTFSILAVLVLQDTEPNVSNLSIERDNLRPTRRRRYRDLYQRKKHFQPRDRNP